MRTIVATRTRVAVDGIDYTFPSDQSNINIVSAHGDNEFTLEYHGFGNRGFETLIFTTLSNDSFQINDFSVSPNKMIFDTESLKTILKFSLESRTSGIRNAMNTEFWISGRLWWRGEVCVVTVSY